MKSWVLCLILLGWSVTPAFAQSVWYSSSGSVVSLEERQGVVTATIQRGGRKQAFPLKRLSPTSFQVSEGDNTIQLSRRDQDTFDVNLPGRKYEVWSRQGSTSRLQVPNPSKSKVRWYKSESFPKIEFRYGQKYVCLTTYAADGSYTAHRGRWLQSPTSFEFEGNRASDPPRRGTIQGNEVKVSPSGELWALLDRGRSKRPPSTQPSRRPSKPRPPARVFNPNEIGDF